MNMFTAKCCVKSETSASRVGILGLLAIASVISVASATDITASCHEVSEAPGKALMQMAAKTAPSMTTSLLALSGLVGGLQAEYFYFSSGLSNVAALDGATADVTRAEESINYDSTRSAWPGLTQSDKFGAKWSGGLRITTAGTYTLETRSDDGSVVLVDDVVVVNNDGLHAMKTKTADIDLTAGDHVIVVKFIENGGGAGIIF
eukprot:5380275-Amphidinium_carterae.1